MNLKTKKLPYPLSNIGAYIRRRRFDRWVAKLDRYLAMNNVKPIHT